MKEKFTPGPWESDETNIKRGRDIIALAYDPNDSCHRTDIGLANARLIAAAPDMYQALKAFKAYMVGPRDLQALLIMVDAALAKADGIA